MPIYEYQCESCGHVLEKLQRISDDPLKDCPDCGAAELRRLVSAAAFRLKGAGWYETDFKKGDKKNLHDSDSSKINSSSDSKSETSKPETSKSETSKSETSKSETSKSETSKSETSKPAAAKTTKPSTS